jgi:phage anti-repressor protein
MASTETRQTYAQWLRERMDEKGLTQRSFARLVNANDPETARRSIRRHLKGMVPLERTRVIYAEVLGTGDDLGPDAEDAEDD